MPQVSSRSLFSSGEYASGKPLRRLGKRCLTTIVLMSLLLPSFGVRALAEDDFDPPDRGLPGRRRGGGSRNPLSQCLQAGDPGFTALLPVSNIGLTIAEYPQIFWFIPQHQAPLVEVSLYSTNADFQDQDLVFLSQFATTGQAGIGQLKAPEAASLKPLAEGETYHWYLSLICDPNDRAEDITVSGWIERVPVPTNLAAELEIRQGIDRYRALAQAGLWFDALDTLATLRCTQPENAEAIEGVWQSLLAQEQVDLAEFSTAAWLRPCSEFPESPLSP
ncbi:MAG: DUF928 domain-containing protein [Prochlorotrichaceae cyanobacterium]